MTYSMDKEYWLLKHKQSIQIKMLPGNKYYSILIYLKQFCFHFIFDFIINMVIARTNMNKITSEQALHLYNKVSIRGNIHKYQALKTIVHIDV